MHDYLRAVGFGEIENKVQLNNLLSLVEEEPDKDMITNEDISPVYGEKSRYFAKRAGLKICGGYDDHSSFDRDYYYPVFDGESVTLCEEVTVEKHSDKASYVGICDNPNIGIPLIFHLQNTVDYLEFSNYVERDEAIRNVCLSAMSIHGKIILPVMKSEEDIEKGKVNIQNRNQKIVAARNGDQDAIESLTLEDLDLYTMASHRVRHEDVLSIVETYFMPYGIACDQYSILANILEVEKMVNSYTNENLYILRVECNSLIFDLCINERDLLGEPEAGRRFKGSIWLQGHVAFQNMI